jgi:hypothetical protein
MLWTLLLRKKNPVRKNRGPRRAKFGRRVLLEPLEDRRLLSVTLAPSSGAEVYGQSLVLTANVSADVVAADVAANTPVTVDFMNGTTTLAKGVAAVPATDGSGTANATLDLGTLTPLLAASLTPYSLTAQSFNPNTQAEDVSAAAAITVTAADTTTTLTPSDPSPVYGEPLTITATVAAVPPGAGTPTGSVVFTIDGSQPIVETLAGGVATLPIPAQNPVAANAWSGSCVRQGLGVGPHTITATYQSDTANFNSGTTVSLPLTVSQAQTTTTLASSVDGATSAASPTPFGHPVLLAATVAVVSPGGGIPGGFVTFEDASNGNAVLGKGYLRPNWQAATPGTPDSAVAYFCVSSLSVGTHSIVAVYPGSSSYQGSGPSNAITVTIGQTASATLLSSSEPVAPTGAPVTFTALVVPSFFGGLPPGTMPPMPVAGGSNPSLGPGNQTSGPAIVYAPRFQPATGSVQFYYSNAVLGIGTTALGAPVTLDSNSVATLTVPYTDSSGNTVSLPNGTDLITAVYTPDATSLYAGSTSHPFTQVIGLTPTTTTITPQSQQTQVNTPLTFTINVAPGGAALNGETVTIIDTGLIAGNGGASTGPSLLLGTATLLNGTATFTLPNGLSRPGLNLIEAAFAGDATFAPSDGYATVLVQPVPLPPPTPPGPVSPQTTQTGLDAGAVVLSSSADATGSSSTQSGAATDQALGEVLGTPLSNSLLTA